ncbi:serine/threonine protein kinase, partial [Streptomyces sp. NPDC005921]
MGPAADLWSLAMMLYVAVEGHHPLRRGTTLATLAAVLSDDIPPPANAGPLTDVLNRVLVRDPQARPDVRQLDRMLADAARQTQTQAPSQTTPTSFPLQPPVAPPQDTTGPQHVGPTSPVPVAPRRRWTLFVLPTAGVALAGALLWTQLPGSGTHDSPSGDSTGTTSSSTNATGSPTATGSGLGETTTTTDLLTPQGIRTAVAAIEKKTGRDRFGKLTVYPDYVIAYVMVKGSDSAYDSYTYRAGQGVEEDAIGKGSLIDSLGTPVRLDGFDWDKVPSLLAQAKKKLNVPNVNTRYLVVDLPGNAFGDPAGMSVLERGFLLKLRFAFDHHVNLRPSKLLPGVAT